MRVIAEHPGIEQVVTTAAVSTGDAGGDVKPDGKSWAGKAKAIRWITSAFVYLTVQGQTLLAASIPLGIALRRY